MLLPAGYAMCDVRYGSSVCLRCPVLTSGAAAGTKGNAADAAIYSWICCVFAGSAAVNSYSCAFGDAAER
eukprot:1735015-Rhodomonas_salina.1